MSKHCNWSCVYIVTFTQNCIFFIFRWSYQNIVVFYMHYTMSYKRFCHIFCCLKLCILDLRTPNVRGTYITCKFSARVKIPPGLNSTVPMVKALLVITCWNELKFHFYCLFNPVLMTGVRFQLGYKSVCFYHVTETWVLNHLGLCHLASKLCRVQ